MRTIELSGASKPLSAYAEEFGDESVLLTLNGQVIAVIISLEDMNPDFLQTIQAIRSNFKLEKKQQIEEVQQEAKSENKFSDCLHMELKVSPMQLSKGLLDKIFLPLKPRHETTVVEKADLFLSIQFNEQWVQLIGGHIRFGIKRGELRLELESCEVPLASRSLAGSFELSIPIERQKQESYERQSNKEASLTDSKPQAKAGFSGKNTVGRVDKIQFTACQITTKGSETDPAWVFEVKTDEPVLKGILQEKNLGTLDVKAKPYCIKATFEVSMGDVRLTAAEGLWSPELSQEKKAVLDRMLAKLLLKHKLPKHTAKKYGSQTYLSQVVLHHV